MTTPQALPQAALEIAAALSRVHEVSAVIGFDAFVDESLRIVDKPL